MVKRAGKSGWLGLVVVVAALALVAGPSLAGQVKPPDAEFDGGGGGKVVFSHDTHTSKAPKCTDCHTKIFKMTKGQRSNPTMKEMQEGKSCGTCHDGKQAFGVTAQDTCAKCHKKS
jgi:c(7)-type cytochrome triheme protein